MRFKDINIGKKLYIILSVVLSTFAVTMIIFYLNFIKMGKANEMNIHTYEVINETKDMLASLINIETGQRGFALSGKEEFLEPYKKGKSDFVAHYD